jgi:hypothetical protein
VSDYFTGGRYLIKQAIVAMRVLPAVTLAFAHIATEVLPVQNEVAKKFLNLDPTPSHFSWFPVA